MNRADHKQSTICILPARWDSQRFPGKPIQLIHDKPMIIHVYERVKSLFPHVYIATDDERIRQTAADWNADCIMTSTTHDSGTSRCFEAFDQLEKEKRKSFKYLINVQGDEPLIEAAEIELLVQVLSEKSDEIATLVRPMKNKEEFENPNRVKVVLDREGKALYFSRAPIPSISSGSMATVKIHLGVYGFRIGSISKLSHLPKGVLEQEEKLEQLRWLENGYSIHCNLTEYEGIGVDTPEDLAMVEELLSARKK